MKNYDIAILGAGPAGLTAGLYAGRGGLKAAIIEKMMPGGLVANTERIDNYPGFPEGISGYELAQRMEQQAKKFGAEILSAQADSVSAHDKFQLIALSDGSTVKSRALIIATGAFPKTLGVPGEKELLGKGVSYCAVCDGAFFKNQPVAVLGGGDSAVQEAIYLAGLASKVTVIHRRNALRAADSIQKIAFANDKIEFAWNKEILAIAGSTGVTGIKVMDKQTLAEEVIPVTGAFIYVGYKPNSDLVKDAVKTDQQGYIITDENMAASAPGIFACGDIRKKLVRQISGAVGDGATAAIAAQQYLELQ
ncbi:MAG: thioredoxin-disulfide reductase [Candidatus Edwardsbacteria bacterium RIFOXYD12_FULL_50_11]|nr:MAG: thioredoxin-disulfide reductase [Candidatus Edwardsbacteria bacterium RifOxyC12_full_54_24]OGF08001.1 MAG: thioredoxin-disulfide reductase [Candidatus Edwardsbacteria bacterium RifOxyA12_full_54_48]OGF10249.1 MAG: thioredoxin-disulfide reductase [Candidatus Edwardsbacteria bacterium GWE2_54_12]OGF18152.1 MAG: thioredoxin-disulfide reductase [Candidatus Edwardsbacteria bacterium RIFOXYD12_FULL_50_11]OGJ19822.1 MAG: thioredoxin-disulfide reductase [Candidatus Edwardsbacteria bacterium Rif